jgi:hypothetical protein
LLAAGDEHSFGVQGVVFECLARRADAEAAVERDFFRGDPEPFEFRDRVG